MIDPSRLENVLPACLYSPTYVVKDFPIARYQGLQFVSHHLILPGEWKKIFHLECVIIFLRERYNALLLTLQKNRFIYYLKLSCCLLPHK